MLLTRRTNRLETQLRNLGERPAATPSAPAFDTGGPEPEGQRHLAALESAKPTTSAAPDGSDATHSDAGSQCTSLSGRLDLLTANTARETAAAQQNAPTVPPAELEALNTRVSALDRGIKSLREDVAKQFSAGLTDPAARRAVTAEALRIAVERGDAFDGSAQGRATARVRQRARTALQPFAQQGVPTNAALARELTALLPALRGAQPSAPARRCRLHAEAGVER